MCELEHTAAPFESSAGISDGTRRAKQKFTFFFCKFRSFHLQKHLGCVSIILLAQLSTASSAAAPSMLGTAWMQSLRRNHRRAELVNLPVKWRLKQVLFFFLGSSSQSYRNKKVFPNIIIFFLGRKDSIIF